MRKKLLFLSTVLFTFLFTFLSCSDEDEQRNSLLGTVWTQSIGDNSYWFIFRNKGEVGYSKTELDQPPLSSSTFTWYMYTPLNYEMDKNNAIKVYEVKSEIDPSTGYAKVNVLLTGYLRDSKIYLEGNGINGEVQTFELTQYIESK